MTVTDQQRWEVFFSGHVQGVGFRFRTQSISAGHEVSGWVRNLPNGNVQMVAEGTESELKSFLDEIRSTMAANIRSTDVSEKSATGEFLRFEIRG